MSGVAKKKSVNAQKRNPNAGSLRICINGHKYYKSSDCPVCPICEKERNAAVSFLSGISAPARRALENAGISTLRQLSAFTAKQILGLHGMGPSTIPKLRKALKEEGLFFAKSK